jgi:transposase-like protein
MKRFTPEQIVSKLRQADVELGKGVTVPEVCRKIEISQQTYYRWRQKYGGMSPELIKELKVLQKDNQRLRKIIADQRIDMEILKEAIEYNSKNL